MDGKAEAGERGGQLSVDAAAGGNGNAATPTLFYRENGFVVFNEYYVDQVVRNLDDPDRLKAALGERLRELSGE